MLLADDSSMRSRSAGSSERLLHHALAVVERAATAKRPHVAAPAGELLRLASATPGPSDTGRRRRPRPAVERGRDRAARVARSRDENRQLASLVAPSARHAGREEARAEILERGGRAVKQLEHATAAPAPFGRSTSGAGKVERFACRSRQLGRERIARDERREQASRRSAGSVDVGRRSCRVGSAAIRSGTYSPPSGAMPRAMRFAELTAVRGVARVLM